MDFKNVKLINTGIRVNVIPPVTAGIKLFLDAGDSRSGSHWYDISGENYSVTLGSGMTYSNEIGGCFNFDGTGAAWADVGDGFGYDYSAGVTVNVLAKFASGGGAWERLVDFGNGSPSNNIILCRNYLTNGMVMDIEGYNDSVLDPGEMPITWDGWAMYTMTANGTYWKQYKNGQFYSWEGNNRLPATTTRYNNYIGRSNWGSDAYYYGKMAVVQIYNRALSDNEILQNYQHFQQRTGI